MTDDPGFHVMDEDDTAPLPVPITIAEWLNRNLPPPRAKLVVVDKSAMPVANQAVRQKRKPDGLPTIVEMVLGVLEGEEDGMRPRDITAIARRKWWPELRGAAVNAVMWKLAGEGRLEKDGHRYRLNGHAGE